MGWLPSPNATFLSFSRAGMFQVPPIAPLLTKSTARTYFVDSLKFENTQNCFFRPTSQSSLIHSMPYLRIIGSKEENNYKKGKKSSTEHDRLPVYLIPSFTSLFFSSYSKDGKEAIAGDQKFEIFTGAYCMSKQDSSPSKDKKCSPLGCGEDSYCSIETDDYIVLGVADGVGGWRKKGVDPSLFSQALMQHAAEFAKSFDKDLHEDPLIARTIIQNAFWRLVKDFSSGKSKPFGSSTACVVIINKNTGKVKFGNLGDSGFVILSPVDGIEGVGSDYRVKFRSQSQQHRFNMPYQITLHPPNGVASDTSELTDTDSSSVPPKNLQVDSGDVVLLMTDGVLDNIFDDELEELVASSIKKHSKKHFKSEVPRLIAQDVAFQARHFSQDSRRESPFTVEARKHGLNHLGGKEDDITVVSAVVFPTRVNPK